MTFRVSKQSQDKTPPPRLTEIHLARKALDGTVASTVLKWGTGALNIDGTRLACGTNHFGGDWSKGRTRGGMTPGDGRQGASPGMFETGRGFQPTNHTGGRWPANLILQHDPGCKLVGSHYDDFQSVDFSDSDEAKPAVEAVAAGQEVEDWACVEGCPCLDLDVQSGVQKSRGNQTETKGGGGMYGHPPTISNVPPSYDSGGGASQYFKQVQNMARDIHEYLRDMIAPPNPFGQPLVLTAWPEGAETWAKGSCTGFVIHGFTPTEAQTKILYDILTPGGHICLFAPDDQPTGHTGAIRLEDAGFEIRDAILWVRGSGRMQYVAKAGRQEREAGCQKLPAKRGFEAVERKEGSAGVLNPGAGAGGGASEVRNFHPTVKPIAVMDRLLADVPKGIGPVLDPFLGSGTTMIACLRSGHDGIGIERQEEYLRISEARVRHWDRAGQGWLGANIQSDLKNEEVTKAEPLDLFDLFD